MADTVSEATVVKRRNYELNKTEAVIYMVDSEEKRDFRRMTMDSDITVCLLGSSKVITVRIKDLSATGLNFHTSHGLMIGEELDVSIEPGKAGITLPFHARVRIVHIEEIVPESEYAIGCKIKEMLPVAE